jgi:hypothetical protein
MKTGIWTRSTCAAYLYIAIGVNYEVMILAKENLDLSLQHRLHPGPSTNQSQIDMMPDRMVEGARNRKAAGTGTMDRGVEGTYASSKLYDHGVKFIEHILLVVLVVVQSIIDTPISIPEM